jgi:LytS/YehU family sensor histidine kinase
MPVTILVSYFVVLHLIPKYLLKKKYSLFILYSFYTFIISFSGIVISIFYGLILSSHLKDTETIALTKSLSLIVLGVYFVIIISTVLSLIIYSYISSVKNEELKNKFLETQLQLKEQELKFLKMQIHPHFLFNTLNTLYGFALKKSDDAPDMILKLSNLLDYILYQVDKPLVLLSHEIKHIEDYISLEKMRFQDSLEVIFEKEIHQENIEIAPMLLLPFVENSFKHGIQIDGVLKVFIKLKTTKNSLTFEISNSTKNNLESKKGIGLENIKKRLEMLYGITYNLNIFQLENTFKVELKTPFKNV